MPVSKASAVECAPVHFRPGAPVRDISVKAHEQLQVTERPEAELVERLDRGCVARDRFDVHIGRTASTRLLDGGLDEPPAHSVPATTPIDNDGLDRGLLAFPEQSRQTHDGVAIGGNPGNDALGQGQVLVEAGPRVIATDRRVGVDVAMVLDELPVQAAASVAVSRSELTNLHKDIPSSAVLDLPEPRLVDPHAEPLRVEHTDAMATWADFETEAPELAQAAAQLWPGIVALDSNDPLPEATPRFAVSYVATVRGDGAPRLHPFCPILAGGRLFAAIPRSSPKGWDLRRDPRCVIHALPGQDDELCIRANAIEVTDDATRAVVLEVVARSGVGGMIESVSNDSLFPFRPPADRRCSVAGHRPARHPCRTPPLARHRRRVTGPVAADEE
jgi:hypothetical protein